MSKETPRTKQLVKEMQAENVLPKMKLQTKQRGKTHWGTTDPNIQSQNRQTGNACAEQQTQTNAE